MTYVEGVFDDILAQVPEDDRPDYFSDFQLTIIDQDVINPDIRQAEVRNWIEQLVLPKLSQRH